jgi:hypothetical protein
MALHSRCHVAEPTWAWYNAEHETITLWCAVCTLPIATFEVKAARNAAPGDPGPSRWATVLSEDGYPLCDQHAKAFATTYESTVEECTGPIPEDWPGRRTCAVCDEEL